jgi:glycosyltransferase involved in cell wall biosynthesis
LIDGRPLRVLHVIDSLAEGGAEQNLLTMVRSLPPPDYEHHLVWLYADDRLLAAFRPHVASTIALRAGRGWGFLRAARGLARHVRRIRPDVVSAKLIRAQLAARFAVMLAGKTPIVSTWECVSYTPDMYDLGWRSPWLRRLTWVLDAGTGWRDAKIVAVSKEVAERNGRVLRVDPRRVTVVYNGVDFGRIVDLDDGARSSLRRELGVESDAPLLLSVGRLVSHKDHATSIRGMPQVLAAYPRAVLAIAGAGPLRAELEALIASLRLERHVRLLGARADVPALLRAADLFLFPSTYEGLGIALMEALATGLPAIASHIGTTGEVAGGSRAVRYFEVGDAAGLAVATIEALRDLPAFTAIARAEARTIRERFAPAAMARGYDAVFRAAAITARA